MLEVGRSVKFGLVPPGDEVSTSGDDRSPSGTEGSRKEAMASGTEGGRDISGRVGRDSRSKSVGRMVGNAGIEGSCTKSFDSNSNFETISLVSTCCPHVVLGWK